MEIVLNHAAVKYLNKTDKPTRKKLYKALDDITQRKGNIIKLKNVHNDYEFPMFEKKIDNYRIIYHYNNNIVYVDHLVPKNNVKFNKYKVHN